MKTLAILAALALSLGIACGGPSNESTPATPAPTPTVTPGPVSFVPAGTYTGRATAAACVVAANPEIQTAADTVAPAAEIPVTMIVASDGLFYMSLPGYAVLNGGFLVAYDGTLSLLSGSWLCQPDGTSTNDTTFSGRKDGDTLTGMVNGIMFEVTMTNIQSRPVTLEGQAGKYRTVASSNGRCNVFELRADGVKIGRVYDSQAAMIAEDPAHLIGSYAGQLHHVGDMSLPNAFEGGWQYQDAATKEFDHGISGYTIFTDTGAINICSQGGANTQVYVAQFERVQVTQ